MRLHQAAWICVCQYSHSNNIFEAAALRCSTVWRYVTYAMTADLSASCPCQDHYDDAKVAAQGSKITAMHVFVTPVPHHPKPGCSKRTLTVPLLDGMQTQSQEHLVSLSSHQAVVNKLCLDLH
jgi:hypothetical protein